MGRRTAECLYERGAPFEKLNKKQAWFGPRVRCAGALGHVLGSSKLTPWAAPVLLDRNGLGGSGSRPKGSRGCAPLSSFAPVWFVSGRRLAGCCLVSELQVSPLNWLFKNPLHVRGDHIVPRSIFQCLRGGHSNEAKNKQRNIKHMIKRKDDSNRRENSAVLGMGRSSGAKEAGLGPLHLDQAGGRGGWGVTLQLSDCGWGLAQEVIFRRVQRMVVGGEERKSQG